MIEGKQRPRSPWPHLFLALTPAFLSGPSALPCGLGCPQVHTIAAKALYVQYPAAPISWQVDFKAFLRDVQASGTPGKKVRSVYVTHPGQAEALLDAARYKELESAEGVCPGLAHIAHTPPI